MQAIYNLLKRFPYLISVIAGIVFYIFATKTGGNMSGLLLNISASLFTIPVVIYSYEVIKEKIAKNSNKDVDEYVKMSVDTELLNLLDRVSPFVAKNVAPGLEKVLVFLTMDKQKMRKNLSQVNPLVFNLATDWKYNENQFSKLLSSELIHSNMTLDERNMLVGLIKSTRAMDYATDPRFYIVSDKDTTKYRVVKGGDFDKVSKFKNRYILLKKSKRDNEFRVAAYNDINESKYSKIGMLTPMSITEDGQKFLLDTLQEILVYLNIWLDSRGDEFILDNQIYKFSERRALIKRG